MNSNNWDVVYAASAEALNSLLRLNRNIIAFSDSTEVKFSEQIRFGIQVSFQELQIVSGGSEKYIVLELKTDGNVNNGEYIYQGLVSRVRIALEFFHENSVMGKIRLACRADGIQFINMDVKGLFPAEQATTLSVLNTVYTDMIVKHADRFSYAFAVVTCLNQPLIGMKQFDYLWYQPSSRDCVGFLAILGVMDNRDISHYPRLIDTNLLFDDKNAQYDCVYLADKQQFLQASMLPSLRNIFPLAQPDSFVLNNGCIQNNGRISLSPFAVGASFYQPFIDRFDFHVEGDKLVTILSGRCPINSLPDSYVDFTLSAKNAVVYNSSLSRIEFVPDPNMAVTANKNIPSYVQWINIISLGTMNLILDGVTEAISACIKTQLKNYSVSSAAVGITAVGWAIDVLMNEGGMSDSLYLRGKRIFQ